MIISTIALLLISVPQSTDEGLLKIANSFRASLAKGAVAAELNPYVPLETTSVDTIRSKQFDFGGELVCVDYVTQRVTAYTRVYPPEHPLVEWPEPALEEKQALERAKGYLALLGRDVTYSLSGVERITWQNQSYFFGLWPQNNGIPFDPFRYLASARIDAVDGSLIRLKQLELPKPALDSVPKITADQARYRALTLTGELRMADAPMLSEYIPMQLVHYLAKGERSAEKPAYFATPEQIELGARNQTVLAYCVGYDDSSSGSVARDVNRKIAVYIDAHTGVPIELMELRAAGGGSASRSASAFTWNAFSGQIQLLGKTGEYKTVPSGEVTDALESFDSKDARPVLLRRGSCFVLAYFNRVSKLLAVRKGNSYSSGRPNRALLTVLLK